MLKYTNFNIRGFKERTLILIFSLIFIDIFLSSVGWADYGGFIESFPNLGNITYLGDNNNYKNIYLFLNDSFKYYDLYFYKNTDDVEGAYVVINDNFNNTVTAEEETIEGKEYFHIRIYPYADNDNFGDEYGSDKEIHIEPKPYKEILLRLVDGNGDPIPKDSGYTYYIHYLPFSYKEFVNSFAANLTPKNMSYFSLTDDPEGQEVPFQINYSLPEDFIKYALVIYPYYYVEEDADIPCCAVCRNAHVLCADGDVDFYVSGTVPECTNSTTLRFNFSPTSVDGVEDDFTNLTLIFNTLTPHENIKYTYYYYLDDLPPSLDINSSFPHNNSVVLNFTYLEMNFTLKDVRHQFPACSYNINGGKEKYLSYEKCEHFTLKRLPQRNISIYLTLYDYANNSRTYLFRFYKAPNVVDCYWNNSNGMCYYQGIPLMKPYLDFDKRKNISLEDNLTIGLNLDEIPYYVNMILMNGLKKNISFVKGCSFYKYFYDNTTLLCTHNNTHLTIYFDKNKTCNPFVIRINKVYQDMNKDSSMFGETYLIANISVINNDSFCGVMHGHFFNVHYDLKSLLKKVLPDYFPYKNTEGNINISLKSYIFPKLIGSYRVISTPEGDYYVKDKDIFSLTSPLKVYLQQRIINKDNISYTYLKTNFPMKGSDILNTSSCTLVSPLDLNITPFGTKIIEAEYKCDIFRSNVSYTSTKISKSIVKYSYIVSYTLPELNFMDGKYLIFSISINDFDHFDDRKSFIIYVDDIINTLNYSLSNDILSVKLPYESGNHKLYIEWWYDMPSEEKKENKTNKKIKYIYILNQNSNNISSTFNNRDTSLHMNKREHQTKKRKDKFDNFSLHKKYNNVALKENNKSYYEKEKKDKKNLLKDLTGKVVYISNGKSFKVIIIFLILIIGFFVYKHRKNNIKKSTNSRMRLLKEIKKGCFNNELP